MIAPIWIEESVVIAIHRRQLAEHGGSDGIRDKGLLESALFRPKNQFTYSNPSIFDLAAAYGYGMAKNHPFIDGNKYQENDELNYERYLVLMREAKPLRFRPGDSG